MITEARIDNIVTKAIPLNTGCKIEREKELHRRDKLKTAIIDLLGEQMAVYKTEIETPTELASRLGLPNPNLRS